jgi:RNA polymerase sigma-70 factor, ECF subfamily
MEDLALVKRFLKGDHNAFTELVDRYSRPLMLFCLKMLHDQEEAKDVSQQVFLKAYEHLPGFSMNSSFKTWLYAIAINSIRDAFRRKKQEYSGDGHLDVIDPAESVTDRLDKHRQLHKLRILIEMLPEKQRLTVLLRLYEELDYKEIANLIGGSEGSARVNFFQGIKTLREKMVEQNEYNMR